MASINLKPLDALARRISELDHDAGREITRAGCIAAGLILRDSVRKAAPLLQPKNIWDYSYTKKGRNRWPHVRGELAESVYFTYTPKNSDIPNGKIAYVVGVSHRKAGNSSWTPGWYAHLVIGGHFVENYWVRTREGKKAPLPKGMSPLNRLRQYASEINRVKVGGHWREHFRHEDVVKPIPFIEEGYNRAIGRATQASIAAADAKAKEMMANL